MIIEIAVTIIVSTITAKRPNLPENGFHVEENRRSERDSFCNIFREPSMRIASNKKNKKTTKMVMNSINLVPNKSMSVLVTLTKLYTNKITKMIRNNAKRKKLLKINKKMNERKRNNMPSSNNL